MYDLQSFSTFLMLLYYQTDKQITGGNDSDQALKAHLNYFHFKLCILNKSVSMCQEIVTIIPVKETQSANLKNKQNT